MHGPRKPWTTADDAMLRRGYGRTWTWALALVLGRAEKTVARRARKLGLRDSSRFWSEDELAYLRERYRTDGARAVAEELDRPLHQVYAAAARYGVHTPMPEWTPAMDALVRRRNAEGLTDAEIATELGWDRRTVQGHRHRLGLPVAAAGVLRRQRDAVRTQWARLGVRTAGELRALAYRRYAVENGWPEGLCPREVQILNVLCAAGVPMSRAELARAIGMRTDREDRRGHLALLQGNGPGGTYTASLMRRGLVAVLKRGKPVPGKGRSQHLYYLGPEALRILEERCRELARTTATGA